jgi:hypothetical protein
VAVTGGCCYFLFEKRIVKRFIHSTLRTAPDLYKNVSLAPLFGSNGNLYRITTQSDMCICAHVPHDIATLVEQKINRLGQQ